MSTNLFLTEGGIGGHMSHLYDNRELTFGKIKKILSAASNGELEGTEKTDGQNLFVSYSAKRGLRGAAKGSRNGAHIKAGGLDPKQLYNFFDKAHPDKQLSNAFSEALATFERAVKALDLETQIAIFGEDNNIYYNAEVMDPRTPNVVKYDTKSLVIHRAGHGEFDKETGKKTNRNISVNAKALDVALPVMQQATDKEEYTVHVNAIRRLEALEDDTALNAALEALNALQSNTGVSDRSTIVEYMITRIAPMVDNIFKKGLSDIDVDIEIQKDAVAWILGTGISLNQIKDSFDKEDKGRVSKLLKDNKKTILQQAIAPLENIIHDFSVEMLRGLESAFILDNREEVSRLQRELKAAKEEIESGRRGPEAIETLMRQMKKIKKIENFATASEGFVFEFEGMTYKFTGNFAPANQIIGIAKYGRGSDVPDVVGESEEEVESVDTGERIDVALFPGAFKPPHKGHFNTVVKLSKIAKRVVIFMSPISRTFPGGGGEITKDAGEYIWKLYIKNSGEDLSNVQFLESPVNSPVGSTYQFIANEENKLDWAQEGDKIIAVASDKPDKKTGRSDIERFAKDLMKYARDGVIAKPYVMTAEKSSQGKPFSAEIMRGAIENGDIKTFQDYLPDGTKPLAKELIKKLSSKVEESISEMIFRMINETMDENTMAGGSIQGAGVSSFGKPNTKNVWKSEEKDEDEEEDNIDEDNIVDEVFKRLFNRPYNKGSKSNVH